MRHRPTLHQTPQNNRPLTRFSPHPQVTYAPRQTLKKPAVKVRLSETESVQPAPAQCIPAHISTCRQHYESSTAVRTPFLLLTTPVPFSLSSHTPPWGCSRADSSPAAAVSMQSICCHICAAASTPACCCRAAPARAGYAAPLPSPAHAASTPTPRQQPAPPRRRALGHRAS